jgi:hypothetical protein
MRPVGLPSAPRTCTQRLQTELVTPVRAGGSPSAAFANEHAPCSNISATRVVGRHCWYKASLADMCCGWIARVVESLCVLQVSTGVHLAIQTHISHRCKSCTSIIYCTQVGTYSKLHFVSCGCLLFTLAPQICNSWGGVHDGCWLCLSQVPLVMWWRLWRTGITFHTTPHGMACCHQIALRRMCTSNKFPRPSQRFAAYLHPKEIALAIAVGSPSTSVRRSVALVARLTSA